jgi:hypothetical protein
VSECCWHGEVDGIVPVLLPLDGADVPARFVLASKPEALTLPQTCCRCNRRRVRSWQHRPSAAHRGQLDLVDVTAASGPCPAPG